MNDESVLVSAQAMMEKPFGDSMNDACGLCLVPVVSVRVLKKEVRVLEHVEVVILIEEVEQQHAKRV